MSISKMLLILICSMIAGSYGWGMRGKIIGGERGGMVPGALFGLCFSSIFNFAYWPYFAAMGTFSMFHGGSCTYGETLRFILKNSDEGEYKGKIAHGMKGIFINGGNWFGVNALYISLLFGYLRKIYSTTEFAALILCVPFIQIIGELIFNKPYDPQNGKFPKIYYSIERREEWGGNLLLCIVGFSFALIKSDFITAFSIIAGYIAGGIGFCLGAYIYYMNTLKHNGKYIFGSFEEKHYIGNWKIMEHVLGAVGFGGSMLFYLINFKKFNVFLPSYFAPVISDNKITISVILACLFIAFLFNPGCAIYEKKTGKKVNDHIYDIFVRPLFASIPVLFALLGTEKAANCYTFIFILYVLAEKLIDSWFKKNKERNILIIFTILVFAAGIVLFFTVDITIPILTIMLTFVHVFFSAYRDFGPYRIIDFKKSDKGLMDYFGSSVLTESHFVLLSIILTAISFIIKI